MITAMAERIESVAVEGGAVPTVVLGGDGGGALPGLVVIPSIFGPAPDLVRRLGRFADAALVAVPDPFWRVGGGVVPYASHEAAFARLKEFDPVRCESDLAAVIDWAGAHGNGRVIGLGICFGGPFVLRFAAAGRLAGVVTWHGSRMEKHLARVAEIRCPLRLHFGEDDPVSPPEAIETIRDALASLPDVSIVVHPGAEHGYSHDGRAYDAEAARAGLDAVGELLAGVAVAGSTREEAG
jgi:carboxymethylenebutenolidase